MGCGSSDAGSAGAPSAPPAQKAKSSTGAGSKKTSMGGQIVMEYFNVGHGRGSSLEFCLAHAKVDWKKNPISFEEWPAKKSSGKTGEFGAMPIIYHNGNKYDCSVPTLRRLCMQFGYYPSQDWKKAAVCDMISETFNDVLNLWSGAVLSQKTDAEKADVFKNSMEPTGAACKLFKIVEAQLNKNGGRFILGNQISMCDFAMCGLTFDYILNDQSPMTGLLKPIVMQNHPRLATYA